MVVIKKNRHPEYWDIESLHENTPIDLELTLHNPDIDIWLWSDQHFNHKNIIGFSNRPYKDIIDMNEQLILNHNSVVKPNDIVIWGGDIGFGNINNINNYLDRCNGYKVHILGNHDMERNGKLFNLHVDETHPCLTFQLGGVQLLFTHYPIDTVPDGCLSIHGHIHTHQAFTPRHINISVEQINYTPINIKTILQHIQEL
jgi:calcineurin-like phosphoesterase family protein